jgi:hypothetical protein
VEGEKDCTISSLCHICANGYSNVKLNLRQANRWNWKLIDVEVTELVTSRTPDRAAEYRYLRD